LNEVDLKVIDELKKMIIEKEDTFAKILLAKEDAIERI
jgi:hypothetical protein